MADDCIAKRDTAFSQISDRLTAEIEELHEVISGLEAALSGVLGEPSPNVPCTGDIPDCPGTSAVVRLAYTSADAVGAATIRLRDLRYRLEV